MSILGGGVTSHPQVPFWGDQGILLVATSAYIMKPALLFVDNTNQPGSNFPGEKGDLLVVIRMGDWAKKELVQMPTSPELACHVLHPFREVHVPYPPGSGFHEESYYSCLGWMTANDVIHPIPGFNPTSQKQVLHSIWRPTSMTFNSLTAIRFRRG